jgi:hypothetical protein
MAAIDPAGSGPKQKKKSASARSKRRRSSSRKSAARPEKTPPEEDKSADAQPTVSRMERTRRLLLAALRVWELKRRVRE